MKVRLGPEDDRLCLVFDLALAGRLSVVGGLRIDGRLPRSKSVVSPRTPVAPAGP
jgi:hypothetical protein